MITAILNNKELLKIHKEKIEENGVSIIIDDEYYDNGVLLKDRIANLAVDEYYNSLKQNVPPSPDNLVVIDRGNNKYSIYLIELKSVGKVSRLNASNIKEKFKTAIDDFMSNRFEQCFSPANTRIIDLNLWVVCNRFRFVGSGISDEEYLRKIKGGVMEALLLTKPYQFRNKLSTINLILSGHTLY
ncbi:hypothetical protein I5L45_01890 [Serratia marcescens]|uniref:hypothetical protein n=1 Tax=Serratia TaxID=613 RepID=UPI0018D87E0F|nr:hypothetical protein [Serratia marcescens]